MSSGMLSYPGKYPVLLKNTRDGIETSDAVLPREGSVVKNCKVQEESVTLCTCVFTTNSIVLEAK